MNSRGNKTLPIFLEDYDDIDTLVVNHVQRAPTHFLSNLENPSQNNSSESNQILNISNQDENQGDKDENWDETSDKSGQEDSGQNKRHIHRVTYSTLWFLYQEFLEYQRVKTERPHEYKTGYSIRDIARRAREAKSTVSYYFQKFRTNPYFIDGKLYEQRRKAFANARKGRPKFYPISLEYQLVDWILRNRQAGLIVQGDEIQKKAAEIIDCEKTNFT